MHAVLQCFNIMKKMVLYGLVVKDHRKKGHIFILQYINLITAKN